MIAVGPFVPGLHVGLVVLGSWFRLAHVFPLDPFAVVGQGTPDADQQAAFQVETLGRERDRVDKLWLVTDDAPLRAEVQAGIGKDTTVLRVPPAALAAWLAPSAGQALESQLYLVDPMGNWMLRTPPDPDPARLKRWEEAMDRVFPDIRPGDRLVGVSIPGREARFYSQERLLGTVPDPDFARAFFAIWLDEKTSEPGLRARMLRLPD